MPGCAAAVIGTVGTRVDGEDVKTALTTPEAPDLHAAVRDDARARRRAPARWRSPATRWCRVGSTASSSTSRSSPTSAATTSTSTPTSRTTSRPRRRCSPPSAAPAGLVNVDDEHGRRLLERGDVPLDVVLRPGGGRRLAGRGRRPDGGRARHRSRSSGPTATGARPAARCPATFNVSNALAALAACAAGGVRRRGASPAPWPRVRGVPGRLERVDAGQDFTVVVDYAHKPDAVAAALAALRPLTDGRVIVVLGAGGDRDPGKRPIMGRDRRPAGRRPRRHRRQPAHRGTGRDPGRDAGRRPAAARPRCSRSATGGPRSTRRSAAARAGRHRADRRQGTRDRPGGRRRGAPLRRPRRRARGARAWRRLA